MKPFDDEDLKNKVLKDFEDEQDEIPLPEMTASTAEPEPAPTEQKSESTAEPAADLLTSPYDFRAEYKERITAPDTEEVKKAPFKFFTLGWHMVGIAALGGALLVLLIVAFVLGLSDDEKAEPIVIEEEAIVVKEKPVDEGGLNVPDQDKTVYKRMRSEQVDSKVERLFPAEETPKAVNRPTTKEGLILGAPTARVELDALSVPANEVKEVTVEVKIPTAVIEKTETPAPAVQTPKAVVSTSAKAAPTTKPVAKTESGDWAVQLISLPSKAVAEKSWPIILKAHAVLLSGYTHRVVQVQIPNKGTYYRLIVGSFKTRNDAKALCDKLKARKQDCTVVKP